MTRPLASRLGPLLVAAVLLAVASPVRGDDAATFPLLVRSYPGVGAGLHTVDQGSFLVHLTSPDALLTVHRNRLTLAPAGEGVLAASVEVELSGRGHLVADVATAGGSHLTTLEDDVTAPRQIARLQARIRLRRTPNGYEVTVVEMPPALTLAIESRLAGQLVAACEGFAAMPLVALDCDAMATGLSAVTVDLPRAGEVLIVPDAVLAPADRAYLDRFAAAP